MAINFGKIYIGNSIWLDGNIVAAALGTEADTFTTYQEIADAITADKTILSNTLNTKGVIAVPSESLVDLVNKVVPLQVNFNLVYTEFFPSVTEVFNTELPVGTLFSGIFPAALTEAFTPVATSFNTSGRAWFTQKENPVMTSNNTPSQYLITTDSEDIGYEAYKAFDGLNTTESEAWHTASGVTSAYIQYQDTVNTSVVVEYWITSRNASGVENEAPKNWTFEGSNDGSAWTVLDTQVNVTNWTQNQLRKFYYNNSVPFSYYKLNITMNNGSPNFISIGELELRSSPIGTIVF